MATHAWKTRQGDVRLDLRVGSVAVEGETSSTRTSRGKADLSQVSWRGSDLLKIGWVSWENGDLEVRGFDVVHPHPYLQRLGRAFRVSATRWGDKLVGTFNGPRATGPDWTTRRTVTRQELDEICGLSTDTVRQQLGGVALGARSQVLGDTGRDRNKLALVSSPDRAADAFAGVWLFAVVIPTLDLVEGSVRQP